MPTAPDREARVEELEDSVRRLADRLRSLGAPRLARRPTSLGVDDVGPGQSTADQARELAADLAALELGVAHRDDPRPPEVPRLAVLSDFAVGDQVAVCGRQCLEALTAAPLNATVWWRGEQVAVGPVVDGLTQRLRALRLAA
ncbi:MAG: hypothetical protein WAN48_01740 [Actinomycetes bacterium]